MDHADEMVSVMARLTLQLVAPTGVCLATWAAKMDVQGCFDAASASKPTRMVMVLLRTGCIACANQID